MIVDQISTRLPDLSPAFQSVARVVVDRPHDVVHWTIRELAQAANVSEPTVLRFCRTIGSEGYQEFKIHLAQSVATAHALSYIEFQSDDTTDDIATKVFDSLLTKLGIIRRSMDMNSVEAAIAALDTAERIDFYGLGVSGRVATDAYHKFFRLGLRSIAYTDVEMLYIATANLTASDAAVVISNTGETPALLEAAETARKKRATLISVTAGGSTLSRLADISIHVDPIQLGTIHSPLISRVPHLLVLDTLALGLSARRGPGR